MSPIHSNLDSGAVPDAHQSAWLRAIWDALALLLVLLGMILVFSLSARNFFSAGTFLGIANQNTETIVIATGMTLVLLLGAIDLSVGSVLGLCNMVLGISIVWYHLPVWLAIVLALGTGLLCGLVNGLITVTWRIPSFIVTLGMLEAVRGLAYQTTQSKDIFIGQPILQLEEVKVFGLSILFIAAIAIVIMAQVILSRTVFGRYVRAIGNNETAVRLSGIDPRPVKVAVFAISGLMAGAGAVMQVSRFGSSNPNYGLGIELSVIAAAVIGGTSLQGGRGSAARTLLGVLIIAVLGQGLNAMGKKEWTKRIVTGSLIVAAVVLDYYRQRLKKRA